MRKQVFGRQLKRDTNERKALFKGLASALVEYERIETTEEKAKAVKGYVEKLVTKAKKHNDAHVRALLEPYLNKEAVVKMTTEIAPRFVDRPGGYIRIIKTRQRFNDNAKMVMMEWVEKNSKLKTQNSKVKDEKVMKETAASETTKPKAAKAKSTKKTEAKAPVRKTSSKKAIKPETGEKKK